MHSSQYTYSFQFRDVASTRERSKRNATRSFRSGGALIFSSIVIVYTWNRCQIRKENTGPEGPVFVVEKLRLVDFARSILTIAGRQIIADISAEGTAGNLDSVGSGVIVLDIASELTAGNSDEGISFVTQNEVGGQAVLGRQ